MMNIEHSRTTTLQLLPSKVDKDVHSSHARKSPECETDLYGALLRGHKNVSSVFPQTEKSLPELNARVNFCGSCT